MMKWIVGIIIVIVILGLWARTLCHVNSVKNREPCGIRDNSNT